MDKKDKILLAREKLRKFKQRTVQRSPEREVVVDGVRGDAVTSQLRALKDKLSEITSSVLKDETSTKKNDYRPFSPVSSSALAPITTNIQASGSDIAGFSRINQKPDEAPIRDENSLLSVTVENLRTLIDSKQRLIDQLLQQKNDLIESLESCKLELETVKTSTVLDLQAQASLMSKEVTDLREERTALVQKVSHLKASLIALPSQELETANLKEELRKARELNSAMAKENMQLKKDRAVALKSDSMAQTSPVGIEIVAVKSDGMSQTSLPILETSTLLTSSISPESPNMKRVVLSTSNHQQISVEPSLNESLRVDEEKSASMSDPIPISDNFVQTEGPIEEVGSESSKGSLEFSLIEQIQKEWQEEKALNERLRAKIQELTASAFDSDPLLGKSTLENVVEEETQRRHAEQVSLLESRLMQLIDEKVAILNDLEDEKRRCRLLSDQSDLVIPEMIIRYHEERRKLKAKATELDLLISKKREAEEIEEDGEAM